MAEHTTSRSLKICQVVPYDLAPSAGGVKVHADRLADALRSRGHQVVLAGPASRPLADPHHVALCGTFNVRGNGSDNLIGLFPSPRRVRHFLREHQFDLLHFHEPQMPLVGYWLNWLAGKTPKVATFHGYSESPDWALGRQLSASLVLGRIGQGIAVSPAALEQAQRAYRGPLDVIPNGVDLRLFRPQTGVPTATSPALRLLFVGRVNEPRKAIGDLRLIVLAARQAGLQVNLDIVGEGQLEPLWHGLPGVRHHQELSPQAFAALMGDCDVLVAPSRGQESFGMILVEAMATGLEIVCSDIAGFRGTTAGTDAQLSPPTAIPAFVAALGRLARLSEAQRTERSERYQAHAKKFDWQRVAARVEAVYHKACHVSL